MRRNNSWKTNLDQFCEPDQLIKKTYLKDTFVHKLYITSFSWNMNYNLNLVLYDFVSFLNIEIFSPQALYLQKAILQ